MSASPTRWTNQALCCLSIKVLLLPFSQSFGSIVVLSVSGNRPAMILLVGYKARALVSHIHCLAETTAMNANRRKILVADCHDDTLIILEKLLEDAGFDTTTVWTAKEALRLLESQVFDLVLIDKYLPDSECQNLLKALHKKSESVACILMSPGEPATADLASLETLGARHVVRKRSYGKILNAVKTCLACDQTFGSAA